MQTLAGHGSFLKSDIRIAHKSLFHYNNLSDSRAAPLHGQWSCWYWCWCSSPDFPLSTIHYPLSTPSRFLSVYPHLRIDEHDGSKNLLPTPERWILRLPFASWQARDAIALLYPMDASANVGGHYGSGAITDLLPTSDHTS